MPNVSVVTCIDNIGLASDEPQEFLAALRLIRDRCAACNAQLKEPIMLDEHTLATAEGRAATPKVFLGEIIMNGEGGPRKEPRQARTKAA